MEHPNFSDRMRELLRVLDGSDAIFRNNWEKPSKIQHKGFEHKFTMLGVDAILNMLYNGMKARDIMATCRERLAPLGIYPLPPASYSTKYRIFRRLANSKCGMGVLRLLIPSHKPAKQ